jgi:acyl-CoA synthetase (AMP-forming)/AMP-acid ligase II
MKGAKAMSTATQEKPYGTTVTVDTGDAFSSLFAPSYDPAAGATRKPAFATVPINTTNKPQMYGPANIQPTFSDPLLQPHSTLHTEYVPKEEYRKAKRSARDAWFAVGVLGVFIAGGLYFFVDRIGSDANKIDNLTENVDNLNKQLTSERAVVMARNEELRLLHDQISDEQHRNVRRR